MGRLHTEATDRAISPWLRALLEKRHEAYNCPTIGPTGGIFQTSVQVNIGSAPPPGQFTDNSAHLGVAGAAHDDDNDDNIVPTVMTCTSHLRAGVHPGIFHGLDLGIYVQLDRTTTIVFSGRHRHGGTAPFVPDDMEPCNSDIRMTWISYPNQQTLDRCGSLALASVPYNNPKLDTTSNTLFSPPQLDTGRLDASDSIAPAAKCTFTRQGAYCMDAEPLELFIEREMLNLKVAVRHQAGLTTRLGHLGESIGTYASGEPMPGVKYGPGGDPTLREKLERELLITRLRMASTMPLMLNRRVQSRKVPGLPRYFSTALAAVADVVLGGAWSEDIVKEKTLGFLSQLASAEAGNAIEGSW